MMQILARCSAVLTVAALLTIWPVPPDLQARDADRASWRVLEIRGGVRYSAPGEAGWQPVRPRHELPGGSRIVSADEASLILGRNEDTIRLGPRSRMVLPAGATGAVEQTSGDARFQVEPRRPGEARFEVETPYATLVVKGTVFDVTVAEAGFEVEVEEGVVGVSSRDGGQAVDLAPGQRARRSAAPNATLEVQVAPRAAFQPAPPAPRAPERARPAVAPAKPGKPAAARANPRSGLLDRIDAAFRDAFPGVEPAGHGHRGGGGVTGSVAGAGRGHGGGDPGGPGDKDKRAERNDRGQDEGKGARGNRGGEKGNGGKGKGGDNGKGKGGDGGKGRGGDNGKGNGKGDDDDDDDDDD